jgi:hypothetical protein
MLRERRMVSVMKLFQTKFLAPILLTIAGCADATNVGAVDPTSATIDPALSRDKTTAALSGIPESGDECRMIAVVGAPIAVSELHDPNLQQTVSRADVASYGTTNDPIRKGVVLATVVGKQPTGELLGNHNIVFAEGGGLRTLNDVISITPTADKCIVNANVTMNFHDGSGAFDGYSGTGTAKATLNFCGGVGHAEIYGRVCRIKK